MSAKQYQDRTPKWVLAVTSDPHIREVYEDNTTAATKAFLAGRINEAMLDTIQWGLKQRAIRRYQRSNHGMRRAA